MKTYFHLSMSHPSPLPASFQEDDVRYPESLVEHFLAEYTHPGDIVLDPFAGYGTTLLVAERMGRIPFGIEIDPQKANYARNRLSHPQNMILGDARSLAKIDLPACDFSITSPPYMSKADHPEDPLSGYTTQGSGYKAYLQEMRSIYRQLRQRMQPTGKVVLEVANLKGEKQVTTLAWDLGQEISRVLHFEGEVIVCWDNYGYGYDHSYCLVFSIG